MRQNFSEAFSLLFLNSNHANVGFNLSTNLVFELIEIWGCVVGGESTEENCQILQTRVNRFKSDKDKIDTDKLKGYSCDVKFTGKFFVFSSSL